MSVNEILNRREELLEAAELVDSVADLYYRDNMINPQDLVDKVYPKPRPETLPVTSIKVKSKYNRYILAQTGRFSYQLINLSDHNRYTDDPWTADMIGVCSSINLNKLEELLSDYCLELSLVDTWS
jgi:hypothetical protein